MGGVDVFVDRGLSQCLGCGACHNTVALSASLVLLSSVSSSTMDHGHPDGETTSTGGHRPAFINKLQRLVELSQDAVAMFYPSLQHVRLGPDPSSLPSVPVARKTLMYYPRIRKRSRGYSQIHPPHEASQSLSTSPASSFLSGRTTNKLSLTTMPFRVLCHTAMRLLPVAGI